MRAKILMLAGEAGFRENLRAAEQILSDVAVAFGHSLVMRGAVARDLTEDDIHASVLEYDAILAVGSRAGIGNLASKMNCIYGLRQYKTLVGLLDISRLKDGCQPVGALVWPLLDTDAGLNIAAVAAAALAKEAHSRFLLLPPQDGESAWITAASKAAMYAALEAPPSLSPEAVLEELLSHLEENLVILTNGHDAGLTDSLLCYLGGLGGLTYTMYAGDKRRFFAVSPETGKPGLFASLYAAAAMLEKNLKLTREAECLKTALDNVLASGWRAREMGTFEKTLPDEDILRLVSEQIALAGELFESF
jgi:hypothetical protein